MMAKLHEGAFDDPQWLFEIKWDGYRAVSEIHKDGVRLYSRNGLSFEDKYPVIFNELKRLKPGTVLDGEIVAFNSKGLPDFQLLQQYGMNDQVELAYYVFDILYFNGKPVKDKALEERKALLQKILPANNIIRYCDHVSGNGIDFFQVIKKKGLEGMIAKRTGSTYVEGARTEDWLKVKQVQSEEAIICGYTEPKGSRKYFGSVILGMYVKGKLTYIGHSGTGFNAKSLKQLFDIFQKYKSPDSAFDEKIPANGAITWLRPELVCNIKYSEITQDGIRRHPVYLGLRVDKDAGEISEEAQQIQSIKPSIMEASKTIGGKKVNFTNTDKIYFPEDKISKGDVIAYYDKVSKVMIKYLKDRPESLRRNPNGIRDEGFFHKDVGDEVPDWIDKYNIWSESANKEINYIVCNNKATLLYMANMGCIEINPWNSRTVSPDNPDYLVLDLDPSEKNSFEQVIETAQVIHEILEKAGCDSYCKTSGATGLHIYVPLGAKYDYIQSRMFAEMVAMQTREVLPAFTSIERSLKKRGDDKIYIDFLQNKTGQTLSAPYSIRPKPGAPVSTPLEWKEVKAGLHPSKFTIKNSLQRLDKKGDLFAPVLKKGINMEKVLKKLGG
ncbi:MAG: DNA ligase D [Chitinophagaceae bacterium]|nr:MAG: DNA ligase D [Chitinophagaceae bacterium]